MPYTIKNFTTKKDVVKQLEDAGVKSVKLPFTATNFETTKELKIGNFKLKDAEGKPFKQKKVTKAELKKRKPRVRRRRRRSNLTP